jgi:hypothetical protein
MAKTPAVLNNATTAGVARLDGKICPERRTLNVFRQDISEATRTGEHQVSELAFTAEVARLVQGAVMDA